MSAKRIVSVSVALAVILCASVRAAEKGNGAVSILYKDGTTVELKSLTVGFAERGLLGESFTELEKLPVKVDKLKLDVPINKLAKIEFTSADKKGENIKVKLTATDGKTLEGVITHEKKLTWKGRHPFADAEATLDPTLLKEIVLRPRGK